MKTKIMLCISLLCLGVFSLPTLAQLTTGNNVLQSTLQRHDLSPLGMYLAADVVVKIVMIGLLLASIVTWTILLYKMKTLSREKDRSTKLLTHLMNGENFSEVDNNYDQAQAQAINLVKACHQEFALSVTSIVSEQGLKERVNARLGRVQASLINEANQGTGILATIGSVAPFIGLFGTVWGIMTSFIGIAQTQTTNLAVVAPGIAEALLATAMGLVAAIPAVMIYNFFSRYISSYRATLTDITTALMILLSRELDQQNPQAKLLKLSIHGSEEVIDDVINSTELNDSSLQERVS